MVLFTRTFYRSDKLSFPNKFFVPNPVVANLDQRHSTLFHTEPFMG